MGLDRSGANAEVIARRFRSGGLGRSWSVRRRGFRRGNGRVSCLGGRVLLGFLRSFCGLPRNIVCEETGPHFTYVFVDLIQSLRVALLVRQLFHAMESAEQQLG